MPSFKLMGRDIVKLRVISLVLVIIFGVLAMAITYRALRQSSTDLRSQANSDLSSREVTKVGLVVEDNLEGVPPYKLIVSGEEEYRLSAQNDLSQYLGKKVTVTGVLGKTGLPRGSIGIPTPEQPTIFVRTITPQ